MTLPFLACTGLRTGFAPATLLLPCRPVLLQRSKQQTCHASDDQAAKAAEQIQAAAEAAAENGKETVAAVAAAPPAARSKKPRLPYLDSLRFFLIAYIATGHFIAFASPSLFVAKLFSQVNVVVGAFFVLSGYVAAYVATELNEYKASARIKPAVSYFVGRVAGESTVFHQMLHSLNNLHAVMEMLTVK